MLAAGVNLPGWVRDTQRLEAGMNLYGQEMDESASTLAANMGWTVSWEPPLIAPSSDVKRWNYSVNAAQKNWLG